VQYMNDRMTAVDLIADQLHDTLHEVVLKDKEEAKEYDRTVRLAASGVVDEIDYNIRTALSTISDELMASIQDIDPTLAPGVMAAASYLRLQAVEESVNFSKNITAADFAEDPYAGIEPGDTDPLADEEYTLDNSCNHEITGDGMTFLCTRRPHPESWDHWMAGDEGFIFAVWHDGDLEYIDDEEDAE
jgi:hypothetical protein